MHDVKMHSMNDSKHIENCNKIFGIFLEIVLRWSWKGTTVKSFHTRQGKFSMKES